jgi:hypothetical protein
MRRASLLLRTSIVCVALVTPLAAQTPTRVAQPPRTAVPAPKPPAPPAIPSTIDDQARFLAGLPVSAGSPLERLEAETGVQAHRVDLAKTWATVERDLLDKMRAWSAAELRSRVALTKPLYYLFGGPDFLMANILFPQAPAYILTGLEPVGKVPALETLKPEALALGLKNLRESMATLESKSYFITSYMAKDFQRTDLKGVMPVLYLFLARTDNRMIESHLIYLDGQGEVKDAGVGKVPADGVPGIKIVFQRQGQPAPQTLFYFSLDLENAALVRKPGFFAFLKGHSGANCYLKAASFILHNNEFSATRDFLLTHSSAVLQDDSGIPFRSFAKGKWDFSFFGIYSPATWIKEFKWVLQPDLQKAFEAAGKPTPLAPLPFKTGYSRAEKSSLMLAVAKK